MRPPQGHLGNYCCGPGRGQTGKRPLYESRWGTNMAHGVRGHSPASRAWPRCLLLMRQAGGGVGEGRGASHHPTGYPRDSRPGTQHTLVPSDSLSSCTDALLPGLRCPTRLAPAEVAGRALLPPPRPSLLPLRETTTSLELRVGRG